jgi:predicted nucleotidyltransferase
MAKKVFEGIRRTLLELLQQKGIAVMKIIVFGSYAKGKEKVSSDIDIIIVSRNFRNKDIFEKVELVSGVHREFVKKVKKPVDMMYYSDIEWDKSYSLIINSAKREGKIIYAL